MLIEVIRPLTSREVSIQGSHMKYAAFNILDWW